MMKFIAMLKDSLRETIDSKVFFVVLAITVLAVGFMATLSLQPNAPEEGISKQLKRFPNGGQEVNLPVVGRVEVLPKTTEYVLSDLVVPQNAGRPWETEYQFTIESRDTVPLGGKIAVVNDLLTTEELREQRLSTGRKTRARKLQDDMKREAVRFREEEEKKGGDRGAIEQRVKERFELYLIMRLTEEVAALTREEMESFIRENLENLGGWQVKAVQQLDVPDDERHIKIKHKVQVKEGDEERIKTVEVEGEVQKFRVTVVGTPATYRLWPCKGTLLFGGLPLGSSNPPGELVYTVSKYGVMLVGAPAIMLLACIITSFYVPNMLRKGTIDLLLAKPIGRVPLMLYKYTGGLTFMFITTTMLIVGLWVALGLRSGIWEPAFLLTIPVLTFEFALFYALSTLAAVLTRSPIVSILLCVVAWAFLWGVAGWAYYLASATKGAGKDDEGLLPKWVYSTGDILHAVAPHYLDLDWLDERVLRERSEAMTNVEREVLAKKYEQYNWTESILITSAYIVVFLGLACWRFAAKDY